MTITTLLSTLTLAVAILGGSQDSDAQLKIPPALRAHVAAETFKPIASVGALPAAIRDGLLTLFKDSKLDLAEPGAPFQSTDVVMGTPLPWRRLIAAGCSSDHCVVYYERGGIAHVYTIVVFKLDGPKARFEFGGAAHPGLAGLDGVKAALASGSVLGYNNYF